MSLELRHLRYFTAVAEELHFGRAAARLHIAQPPLSQQIRQLEALVGTELLRRTSRRVELTPAGAAFLEGARRTLNAAAGTLEVARRVGRGELASVRVGFTDSAALSIFPAAVRNHRRAFPQVHLDLVEGATRGHVQAVEDNLLDLAVVRGPVAASPGVVAETVFREPLVVAMHASHPLAAAQGVALAALRDEPMVLFPRPLAPEFHDWITRLCMEKGFVPRVAYNGAEYQTILALVAADVGVSLVPASVRGIGPAEVCFRPLLDCADTAEIAVVYRPDRRFPAMDTFMETLRGIHLPAAGERDAGGAAGSGERDTA
ncbi:MAG TPA: LysR substrate-binding domain-containing protein [Longimicrobium sp.]|nr:LysR substrate-binding domain-containing protein [Longimicrobium sp.]